MPSGVSDPSRIKRVVVCRSEADSYVAQAKAAFTRAGFPDAQIDVARSYRLEGEGDLSALNQLFANPAAGEYIDNSSPKSNETRIEVAYRPAVIDPETHSGLAAAEALGVPLDWMRSGVEYRVSDIDADKAREVVEQSLLNPVVQIVVGPNDYRKTLRPTGTPSMVQHFDLLSLNNTELEQLSTDMSWYAPLEQLRVVMEHQLSLGRPWRDTELEIIFQSWSDHCFHATWKALGLLDLLQRATRAINHPLCLSVFSDNAGAIQFYDGWAIVIKGESHNHPTRIFVFGGVQTKHGGLLRDILGMGRGGYPIGASTIMGTMDPKVALPAHYKGPTPYTIVRDSILGTATYCNPMGVPMMYAAYRAHEQFNKCWALGVSIGIMPQKFVHKLTLRKGDRLVLLGGATGRDGVHGATASSAGSSADMIEREGASVQIGDPIMERAFTTLIPQLRDQNLIRALTDLGAGGISSAVGEMVKECGADVDLTNLPLKDLSLASWEKLLSESQERMLAGVAPKDVDETLETARRYSVPAFVLGTCRSDRQLIVHDNDEVVAELDLRWMWSACPIAKMTVRNPKVQRSRVIPRGQFFRELAHQVVADYACCDQSLAIRQFDSTVQGRTVIGPLLQNDVPSDVFVSAPIRGKHYGAVSSYAYNPRYGAADPVGSVRLLMTQAISRTIAAGVSPQDTVLCANWYCATRTPEQRWYLQQAVRQAARLTKRFGIPIISGKDSSSGTYTDSLGNKTDVPFTCVPSTLGRLEDVRNAKTKQFQRAGDSLYLIHPRGDLNLAGSVVSDYLGRPPRPMRLPWVWDEQEIVKLWTTIHRCYSLFSSIACVTEGGAFMQAFHGCLASGLGATISLPETISLWWLFGEQPSGFLVSTSKPKKLEQAFADHIRVPIGHVQSQMGLQILQSGRRALSRNNWPNLVQSWKSTFPEALK